MKLLKIFFPLFICNLGPSPVLSSELVALLFQTPQNQVSAHEKQMVKELLAPSNQQDYSQLPSLIAPPTFIKLSSVHPYEQTIFFNDPTNQNLAIEELAYKYQVQSITDIIDHVYFQYKHGWINKKPGYLFLNSSKLRSLIMLECYRNTPLNVILQRYSSRLEPIRNRHLVAMYLQIQNEIITLNSPFVF